VLHTDGTAAAQSRVTARAEARTHLGGVVGTQIVQAQPRRGVVFLTERRPGSAQVTLAIGWVSPLHGWAPYALGVELPFWLKKRAQWRRVLPLLRQYERLRHWCAPTLRRVPGTGAVALAELAQLGAALEALATTPPPAQAPSMDNARPG